MPRFVLLYHDCPPGYARPSHWDLMLEAGDVLETWALAELPRDWNAAHTKTIALCPDCPPLAAGNTVSAEHLAGHRLAYLDYEGPVSDGRGCVVRISAGTYLLRLQTHDFWDVSIDNAEPMLFGDFALQCTSPNSALWRVACREQPRSGEIA